MAEAAKKIDPTVPECGEDIPMFAEEVRLPLSNADRDAFLKALEEDTEPNEALRAAAQRYRETKIDRE
jgi:uncharacterized protein (DUF1778 family)